LADDATPRQRDAGALVGRRSLMKIARPTLVAFAAASMAAAATYEGPRTFKVSELLTPAQVKGPYHTVAPTVKTEGYLHVFDLQTKWGPMEAEGKSLLLVRIHETQALAQLDEISKSEVFLKAAGTSVLNVGKGVAAAIKDPEATAKGIGGGLKRFGTNLGRKAKRTADKGVDSVSGDDDGKKGGEQKSTSDKATEAGTGMAYSVLGVNSAARRWAQKVGADPYTTNPILKKALTDIGQIDAAGGIAAKVAVPIPMVVGTTASVGNLVWSKDPEELLKLNELQLKELGVKGDTIKQLYLSKGFTLTMQTLLANALHAVKVPGCGDYVATAAEADTEREAVFFVESALMLSKFNEQARVAAVLTDSRALVAKAKDGRAVVLLPVDWVRWTAAFEKALAEIETRARQELGSSGLELRMTGTMSAAAKKEVTARGFKLTEGLPTSFDIVRAKLAAAAK
jgi:hypothetical protein